MRLTLTCQPGELAAKRDQLLRALSYRVIEEDPELADRLLKAAPPPVVQPREKALQALQLQLRQGYAAIMAKTQRRIDAILDGPETGDAPKGQA